MELYQSVAGVRVAYFQKRHKIYRGLSHHLCFFIMILFVGFTAHGQVNSSTDSAGQPSSTQRDVQKESRDYLVTLKGDTLYGNYRKPVFGHSAFSVNGKKIILDPEEYGAYHANGALYRSIQVSSNTKATWMECLEDGAICLYQYIAYKVNGGVNDPRNLPGSAVVWLAQKNAGPLMNVNGVMATTDLAKHNLERLLLDSPDLSAEAKALPFSTRTVQGLIQAYNRKFKPLK